MNECSIAIVGATGAVGQVFLSILGRARLPLKSVRLCASERSVGKKLKLRSEEIEVELATPELLSELTSPSSPPPPRSAANSLRWPPRMER